MNVILRIFASKFPWLTLTLSGLMAALFVALGPAPAEWIYDRGAITNGEWWRLISGHWLHSDPAHLGWNLGAFVLLGCLVERRSRSTLILSLALGTFAVDLTLWTFLSELERYCGLSGVLNSVFLVALTAAHPTAARRSKDDWLLLSVALLSLGKILVELVSGQALFTDTAWPSVPAAHLAGWLAGLTMIVARAISFHDSLSSRTTDTNGDGGQRHVRPATQMGAG